MTAIDPIEFGKLIAEMESMKSSMKKMEAQMETMMALVNQGRGVFWVAVIMGGAVSSLATFVVTKMQWLAGVMR
jgi:DNA-binding protein YbaB